MANRVSVTSQSLAMTGLVPALTAPTADGDVIDGGKTFLMVDNASGAAINVTVSATASQYGLTLENLIVAVAAGTNALIGPFPLSAFAQPAGANASGGNDQGRVYVSYSAVGSVTRAVVAYP